MNEGAAASIDVQGNVVGEITQVPEENSPKIVLTYRNILKVKT